MEKLITVLFLSLLSLSVHARGAIVVTAATGALGGEVCEVLAKNGHNLIISGRNVEKLQLTRTSLLSKYKGITVKTIVIDFSDISTIEAATQSLVGEKLKGIVLIGPRPVLTKTGIPTQQEWTRAFAETFIAPLEVLRLLGPQIKRRGSIVIMSGETSKRYLPLYPNTNVMRLAWSGEIKNLVYFFAPRKIRVNAVSPGIILTPLHKDRIKAKAETNSLTFEEQLSKETAAIPLKNYGNPEDVAHLIDFLLSRKSAHINGSNILLDGGESDVY